MTKCPTTLIFDLCAGARGWEAGNDDPALRSIGFDVDPDACATARAAGLHAVQDDIARLVPLVAGLVYGHPEGLIGSPPCQLFSTAGKGTGRQIMAELHVAMRDAAAGASDIVMARHRRTLSRLLHTYLRAEAGRKRSRASKHRKPDGKPYTMESTPIRRGELRAEANRMARNVSLVWQPARWAARLRPRWIALEQVPAVLPLWETMARALEVHGYRCWTGVLSSERFGVPQTRKRAILLASLDGQPQPPEATHQAYVAGEPAREAEPDLFGPGVQPWMSMAEALGWGEGRCGFPRRDDTGTSADGYRERDWRSADQPAFAMTEKVRSAVRSVDGAVKLRGGTGENATERGQDEPAPTLHTTSTGYDGGERRLYERAASEPSPTVVGRCDLWEVGGWPEDRPATTVAGDARVFPPGHKINAADRTAGRGGQLRSGAGHTNGSNRDSAVRVSVAEAAILQSFPPDWPWQGTQSSRYQQIGNAIPPLLARSVLQAATAPTALTKPSGEQLHSAWVPRLTAPRAPHTPPRAKELRRQQPATKAPPNV